VRRSNDLILSGSYLNFLQNTSVVRGMSVNPGIGTSTSAAPLEMRRTQTPVMPAPIAKIPPPATDDAEFFSRIQNCHLNRTENPLSHEPPAKRPRSNSFSSQAQPPATQNVGIQNSRRNDAPVQTPRRKKAPTQTPTTSGMKPPKQRQVTLESFLAWKPPGSEFANSNHSITSKMRPTPSPPTKESQSPSPEEPEENTNWSRGGDFIWIAEPPAEDASSVFPLMPLPVPKGQLPQKQPVATTSATTEAVTTEIPVEDLFLLNKTFPSSVIFKKSNQEANSINFGCQTESQ